MKPYLSISRLFIYVLLLQRTPKSLALWNRHGRGIASGKRHQLANANARVDATPTPRRQSFVLLSVAGYVVAGILPSSTPWRDDVVSFVNMLRRADGDSDEHEYSMASASSSVQRATGAALGIIVSRPLQALVPVTIKLSIAALVAGELSQFLRRELGKGWYRTGDDELDSWLRHLDMTLDSWRCCIWSSIQDPEKAYRRIRRGMDELLRQGIGVPPHVANGIIGGLAVGLTAG